MKVRDVMTESPRTCTPDTNLSEAGALMLDADCGMLPIVDAEGKLSGVVTDRDLYIALATRNMRASELRVGDVAQRPAYACEPDDDVHEVLAAMRKHRIRRLPVEGFGGIVTGVVSMNDILLAVGRKKGVRSDEVVDVLQTICAHHQPVPHVTAG
jgi:CBS domain-containing protein